MNLASDGPFSRRHGYSQENPEISIREDAPESLRSTVLYLSEELGLTPGVLRDIVCRVVRALPDESNWSAGNVWAEVQRLVKNAKWYRIYDLVEAIYEYLSKYDPVAAGNFHEEINLYFKQTGIGWQLLEGEVRTRGAEGFEAAVGSAKGALTEAGQYTAAQEIAEALRDLSRRPEPDLTGAIQHGLAALECVAREFGGEPSLTLGKILQRSPGLFPPPLQSAVEKIWGYASDIGRHVREGRRSSRIDTELVVAVSAAASTYIAQKLTLARRLASAHSKISEPCEQCGEAALVSEEGCKKCLSCGFIEC